MFIVSPTTLLNASALEMQRAPKRMLGRITLLPKRGIDVRTLLRLIFEIQILRYLVPLIPFVVAMLIWPHLALPISQAPVPMLIVIAVVETKVLSIKPDAREGLISDTDMARGLDALRFNGRAVLTRLATGWNMTEGELLLVVEQSEMARVPALTLVSIQRASPNPTVMDLTPDERTLIAGTLFDEGISEKTLHRISLRTSETLHAIPLDAQNVSAHARMAAVMQSA